MGIHFDDVVITNGDAIGIGEVKYKAHENNLNKLDRKMRNIKKLFPIYQNYKQYGAIASFHINDAAKKEALKRGYFVLQRSGDLVHSETSRVINRDRQHRTCKAVRRIISNPPYGIIDIWKTYEPPSHFSVFFFIMIAWASSIASIHSLNLPTLIALFATLNLALARGKIMELFRFSEVCCKARLANLAKPSASPCLPSVIMFSDSDKSKDKSSLTGSPAA
jgi:hypothetical protein